MENAKALLDDFRDDDEQAAYFNFNFNRKRIVMKDYLEDKMKSIDQQERELEIQALVTEHIVLRDISRANKLNKNLDKVAYDREMLKIRLK